VAWQRRQPFIYAPLRAWRGVAAKKLKFATRLISEMEMFHQKKRKESRESTYF
jgi:hypothetical protein